MQTSSEIDYPPRECVCVCTYLNWSSLRMNGCRVFMPQSVHVTVLALWNMIP